MSLDRDADDWFARMRGPEAEEARLAFDAWYAVREHAAAYDRRSRAWDATKFLTNTATGKARNLGSASIRPGRGSILALAAALLGTLIVGSLVLGAMWRNGIGQAELVRTEVASLEEEPRHVSLPDGSALILDRGARVQIAFGGGIRRLRLLAGRARFSVAHDKSRPFIVETGAGRVTAHGTLFDVDLTQGAMKVNLLEGAVEVRSSSGGPGRKSIELAAGQAVAVAGGSVGEAVKLAASNGDWTDDMLVLAGAEIADAVTAFNRTASVPIVFDARPARPMKVTGAFKRSDPQLFANQLAQAFGLTVERRNDGSLALVAGPSKKNLSLP